jgi:putative transposase
MSKPSVKPGQVLIPKLGYVKFHEYRPLKGTPLDATIKRDPAGKWWVTFQCDLGTAPERVTPSTHTGIDVGLTSFATLADGESVPNPRFFRASEVQLAARQRRLELKKRGSSSRKRAKRLVARSHEHIRNQRLDHARKLACTLFSRFDMIAYEDLNVVGVVRYRRFERPLRTGHTYVASAG